MNEWIQLLNNQKQDVLKYCYVDQEGIQYTTNTHVLFAMNKEHHLNIECLPQGKTFPNVKSCIPFTNWGKENIIDFQLLKNPMKFNEDKRKSKNNPYIYILKDHDGFNVIVNNNYLKMAVDILGDDSKVYAISSTRPVLIESEKGKAIIMPIIRN